MKRIPLLVVCLLLVTVFVTASVFAQEGAADEASDGASLSIVDSVPVMANLEVSLNGEIYQLTVPVTLNIDAQKDLAEALLTVREADRVGDLEWVITSIREYEDEFELSRFSTLEPSSPENKLVVVNSDLTNLRSVPIEYYVAIRELFAYDELGNLYEVEDDECDSINPGVTLGCVFAFDVPKSTTILGLDLEVVDNKRIPFVVSE